MPQFDYYANPNRHSRDWAPYIVDLQHDMLSSLRTRIMAPLVVVKPSREPMMRGLNPVVSIDEQPYFVSTSEMASVPVTELSELRGNLSAHRGELLAAVDVLFTAV
ncbi:MAG: CcdB family protein [Gammaproteobacteria bacterium]|nr:CcdB family protein [Gammaproteobacteria bacterium]MCP5137806.1 CcdB family protein [Gammaproteobacteria bacterium]